MPVKDDKKKKTLVFHWRKIGGIKHIRYDVEEFNWMKKDEKCGVDLGRKMKGF